MDLWGYLTPQEERGLDAGDRHTVELIARNRKYANDLRGKTVGTLMTEIALQVGGGTPSGEAGELSAYNRRRAEFADLILACDREIEQYGIREWCVRWLCENVETEEEMRNFLLMARNVKPNERIRTRFDPDYADRFDGHGHAEPADDLGLLPPAEDPLEEGIDDKEMVLRLLTQMRYRVQVVHAVLTGEIEVPEFKPGEIGYSKVYVEAAKMVADLEQLQVQLAGCLTAAEGGTSDAVVAKRDAYGWSLAYQRTLDLRRRYDEARKVAEEIKTGSVARGSRGQAFADWPYPLCEKMVKLLLEPLPE